MKKLRLEFTVKFADEVILSAEEYKEAKKVLSEGGQIVSIEDLKEEIADCFGASKDCVEVVEHFAEVLDEGEGE